jgi:hypothetical protein
VSSARQYIVTLVKHGQQTCYSANIGSKFATVPACGRKR